MLASSVMMNSNLDLSDSDIPDLGIVPNTPPSCESLQVSPPSSFPPPAFQKMEGLNPVLMLLMIKSSESKRIPLVVLHGNVVIKENLVHNCGPNIFLITY